MDNLHLQYILKIFWVSLRLGQDVLQDIGDILKTYWRSICSTKALNANMISLLWWTNPIGSMTWNDWTVIVFAEDDKAGEKKEHEVQWVVDNNFNKELERLKIPQGKYIYWKYTDCECIPRWKIN